MALFWRVGFAVLILVWIGCEGDAGTPGGEEAAEETGESGEETGESGEETGESEEETGESGEETGESGEETGPCIPDCLNKECGADGCGDLCGECADGAVCNDEDKCEGAAEETGEPTEESGEETGEPTEESGEETGEPAEESGEETGEPAEESGEETGEPAEESGEETGSEGLAIGWCNLQHPLAITAAVGDDGAEVVYGQAHVAGCTENADCAALSGELGWGPEGADAAAFTWTWGALNEFHTAAPNNDEYMAAILPTPETPGTYRYTWRFSLDGGVTWSMCDGDGTDNGVDPEQFGVLTVIE